MRLITAVAVLSLLAGPTFAQSAKQQPFFFPAGLQTTIDPILQRQEYGRYLTSTWACNQGNPNGPQSLMPDPGSISLQTSVASTSSVTDPHAKMKVILDNFIRMPDGKIRVTTLCGQYFITEEQLKVVETQLVALTERAAAADNEYYVTIMNLAIDARAKKLGVPRDEFAKSLDEPMIDNPHVTYREFNRIPKSSKASDFVPRELHLGWNIPLGGILGVTWLNTGIIYYNPDAWIVDVLTGRPKVMQHEMVHVNINIEKFPMAEAFDAELLADQPIVLYPENAIDLQSHGYAKDLREMFEIYFNFDFEEMNKQIYKVDLAGNQTIDEEKYRYYFAELQKVKAEASTFFQTVTIPEFYSDLAWWSSVNNIRGDKNSVFRMTLAQHYNPTILGDAKTSLDWAESHRQIIYDTAQRAFEKGLGGEKSKGTDDSGDFRPVPPYFQEMFERTFTPKEQAYIIAYYQKNPAELEKVYKMTPAELTALATSFKTDAAKTGMVQ